MKTKEIVQEGIFDVVKGFVKGGRAGATAAQAQAKGAKDIEDLTNRIFQKWNEYYAKTKDNNLLSYTNRAFNTNLDIAPDPRTKSPAAIKDYFREVWQMKLADKLPPAAAGQSLTGTAQPAPTAPSTTGTAQPAPLRVGTRTPSGTTLIKVEPLTLQRGKIMYMRGGPKGEWTRWGSNKPLTPIEQRFLDSEEDILTPN